MSTPYCAKTVEAKWADRWEALNIGQAPTSGKPYCIMLPPPNVTGSLHMGHGFQHTLMDALIRYHRMRGYRAHWQAGLDHAGIATQMVVERQLAQSGQNRHDLGREAFLERVWDWKAQSGGRITSQMKRLGLCLDWSSQRFTMDEGLSEAVKHVFVQWYQSGLIYRGERLVNWDPVFETAVSDLEVQHHQEAGHLWHILYPLEQDPDTALVIATTRPETLFGDQALAVHPDDERYQHLIGQRVHLPLTDRCIPIIADDYVDPEFGTGCVKITPAHDFNDYQVGLRHDLALLNILTPQGTLNDQVPEAFQGLSCSDARTACVSALRDQGFWVKTEAHQLTVPRGDRSGAVIEPYLTPQWFVKASHLAEEALTAVQSGDIQFIPENWQNTYYRWLEDIQDWCISRQLWWGHRIPAWFDEDGQCYVGMSEAGVRATHQLSTSTVLTQDDDVLDTWFSSALWPFSTLGWPEDTEALKTFFPTSVLVTGFDIIFFWVARMIMASKNLMGDIPFQDVFVTGLIRDAHGDKMSKSKGNVIDPLDLIDGIDLESLVAKRTQGLMQPHMAERIAQKTRDEFPEGMSAHGTDALRMTFCALASTGRDIHFDIQRLNGYRNFCNKLWHATRFVLMQCDGSSVIAMPPTQQADLPERWIMHQLQQTIATAHDAMTNYRFDHYADALFHFIWDDFCDWYLECAKVRLPQDDQASVIQSTLVYVLSEALKMLHPIMPYITDELAEQLHVHLEQPSETLLHTDFPTHDPLWQDASAARDMHTLQTWISSIRTTRSELGLSPKTPLRVIMKAHAEAQEQAASTWSLMQALAGVPDITWGEQPEQAAWVFQTPEHVTTIPLAGLVDIDALAARLKKKQAQLQKQADVSERKLSQPRFVDQAPEAVVVQERERLAHAQEELSHLKAQLAQLKAS